MLSKIGQEEKQSKLADQRLKANSISLFSGTIMNKPIVKPAVNPKVVGKQMMFGSMINEGSGPEQAPKTAAKFFEVGPQTNVPHQHVLPKTLQSKMAVPPHVSQLSNQTNQYKQLLGGGSGINGSKVGTFSSTPKMSIIGGPKATWQAPKIMKSNFMIQANLLGKSPSLRGGVPAMNGQDIIKDEFKEDIKKNIKSVTGQIYEAEKLNKLYEGFLQQLKKSPRNMVPAQKEVDQKRKKQSGQNNNADIYKQTELTQEQLAKLKEYLEQKNSLED